MVQILANSQMLSTPYTVSSIGQILHAEVLITGDGTITTLLTDSRRISNAAEGLFFALSYRRDGHEFLLEAYQAGVRSFVVNHQPTVPLLNANYLVVSDVLKALQQLAAYHRGQFNLQVIGVTGSNGKTIVKEWLYQLMAPEKSIVRSPKSYNSQIGVPLSVWRIGEGHNLGIFEAGISTVEEMTQLEQMIRPDIGVLTHIGSAHDEGFSSRKQKVEEKLKLFKHSKQLIGNYEELLDFNNELAHLQLFTWSRSFRQADLYVFSETVIAKNYYLRAYFKGNEIEGLIPFLDQASVENAIVCWATLLAMGYEPEVIDDRLERLAPVSMRLELKNGINDCSIIDDSYNSDIQSLEIALNFLDQQNQHIKKTLVLSDIYQSGLRNEELYKQVSAMLGNRVTRFIGVGEAISAHAGLFNIPEKRFFRDTQVLLSHFNELHFNEETVLLKGARNFEFEKISHALVQKAHETVMEINLNGLLNNLNFYKAHLKPGVKIMAMVKAFSYGSGTFEVANILQYHKVDYLAVAYIDEGVALRQAGIRLPLMVMNPEPAAFDKLVEFNLEPELYSFGLLDNFLKYAQQNDIQRYPVHIKIDTGMHRLGFETNEVESLCEILEENPLIKIVSVLSHLVASDAEQHDAFTLKQIQRFEQACEALETALGYSFIKHISNTSGVTRWPSAQFDMVRIGIGLYGIDVAVKDPNALQPIATLKTSISQVKHVKAGETIGYNRNGSLSKNGKIATVRIGYADGYLRAFGNGVGCMLIKGRYVKTVGNIAMDMCMIDVSEIEVNEGDEVIIFNDELRIEELARQIGTIPYEILTNISQRVKRVYYYE